MRAGRASDKARLAHRANKTNALATCTDLANSKPYDTSTTLGRGGFESYDGPLCSVRPAAECLLLKEIVSGEQWTQLET